MLFVVFFFFSSRRRHTRYWRDWSSDVCSSDLDAGVHEFLRKPFTSGDLLKRVENVALKPRTWIEAVGYVGPDRRRFNSGEYSGPTKRKSDRAATGAAAAAAEKDQAM